MKILISSRSFGKIGSGAIETLKNIGLEPILNPYGKKLVEQTEPFKLKILAKEKYPDKKFFSQHKVNLVWGIHE